MIAHTTDTRPVAADTLVTVDLGDGLPVTDRADAFDWSAGAGPNGEGRILHYVPLAPLSVASPALELLGKLDGWMDADHPWRKAIAAVAIPATRPPLPDVWPFPTFKGEPYSAPTTEPAQTLADQFPNADDFYRWGEELDAIADETIDPVAHPRPEAGSAEATRRAELLKELGLWLLLNQLDATPEDQFEALRQSGSHISTLLEKLRQGGSRAQ